MSNDKPNQLILQIELEQADQTKTDRVTRQLRSELLNLDVDSVEILREGDAPPGTMSAAEAITLGALAVIILPSVIPALIEYLKVWRLRNTGCIRIKGKIGEKEIEIEVPETTTKEQLKELIVTLTEMLENKVSCCD